MNLLKLRRKKNSSSSASGGKSGDNDDDAKETTPQSGELAEEGYEEPDSAAAPVGEDSDDEGNRQRRHEEQGQQQQQQQQRDEEPIEFTSEGDAADANEVDERIVGGKHRGNDPPSPSGVRDLNDAGDDGEEGEGETFFETTFVHHGIMYLGGQVQDIVDAIGLVAESESGEFSESVCSFGEEEEAADNEGQERGRALSQ